MQINREEIVERMARAIPEDGSLEVFPGFLISRSSKPTQSVNSVYQPAFCFVAQGSKQVLLGEEMFRYDPGHYLIFTVDLPVVFQVEEASKEQPYLGLRLNLDPSLVASVLMESGVEAKKGDASAKAIDVSPIGTGMLDAVVRLVRLLDTPDRRKFLATLIIREIIYRLLEGGQGARLSHLLASGGDTGRISRAIGRLRENFNQPLRMDEIARELGMSVSGFHHHFKSVTAMSPLQFQKQIRLQEARRLMLGEDLDAASAGFRVGYEDPTYFSRDYKKLFGAPPQRDIARLRSNLEL
ncbi:MAG TPA: AraC family transcriptional regulator [Blastocatellia bacterium]|nr:AraC family transcriptional regulator [Blastocatellia bacterium]